MKKVLIYAYTNFNLGDDLFIKILCERYPKTKFYLLAPKKYRVLFKQNKNLIILPSDAIFNRSINFFIKKFNKNYSLRNFIANFCDVNVYIGGSIFMQKKDWKLDLNNKRNMKAKNKPFFVLGANFGPFTDKAFYKQYKNLFKEYTDICFRDTYSYKLFSDLENVRIAEDIVFQLSDYNSSVNIAIKMEKNIVISIIKPSFRQELSEYEKSYYEKIREIILFFVNKEYTVNLMSFCKNQGDEEAIESILTLIPKIYLERVNTFNYEYNIEEAINLLAGAQLIIGTRFHAMILGWVLGKPVYPIIYSEKMTNVIQDVNFKGFYGNIFEIELINADDIIQNLEVIPLDVSQYKLGAENQFKVLDQHLNRV